MARGRMISASLGSSRKFHALLGKAGKLGEFAQALYPLIVTHSDDFGRLEGDAFTIKHKIFPSSPRQERDFQAALDAMHAAGLIYLYIAQGVTCIQVLAFDEHQSGLHKRTKSRFPEPPGDSGNFPEIPSEEKGREEEEKRSEQNGSEGSAHARSGEADSLRTIPTGLSKHPAVVLYWTKFRPARSPSIAVQEQIERKIGDDLAGWGAVLDFWDANGYRPESVGKMLDKYDENQHKAENGNAKSSSYSGSGSASVSESISKAAESYRGANVKVIGEPPKRV